MISAMKVLLFLVLSAIIALALAQTPSKPTWPNSFSSTILRRRDRDPRPAYGRWFYDFSQKKDRYDGIAHWQNEDFLAEIIFDHSSQIEYDIFFQPGLAVCFTNALNHSIPHPSFSGVTYLGKAIINYVPVYHWFERDATRRITFQVWDTQDTRRDIVRMDFDDERTHRSESVTFFEFDRTPNNPNIYDIPDPIKSQCTPYPGN